MLQNHLLVKFTTISHLSSKIWQFFPIIHQQNCPLQVFILVEEERLIFSLKTMKLPELKVAKYILVEESTFKIENTVNLFCK